MGKELPMACSEEERRAVLLASSGYGVSSNSSLRRDKRQEEASNARGGARGKAKDTPPKSTTSPKAKSSNASPRRKGYRRSDKDREPHRRAKGADSRPRRSASELGVEDGQLAKTKTAAELGVEWIGSYCPSGEPHRLVDVDTVDGGVLFRCTRCLKHKWLPAGYNDATKLSLLMERYGTEAGYLRYLDRYRAAKVMVAKLQDLWYARQRIKENKQFAKLVAEVMSNSEYDRKEEDDND